MRCAALFLFLLFCSHWLFAQVQGTVFDAETRYPLPDVLISTATAKAASDGEGRFSLPADALAVGAVLISFNHPRYQDTSVLVHQPTVLRLYLSPGAVSLSEVEVVAVEGVGTEVSKLDRKELESISKPLGEADLIRALQYKPGVLQTGETQTGLFVRGGANSQTAILLQGVPVFNSAHLLGINSSLDPDAYESVSLTTGGFRANMGGWLSAYLQAEPRAVDISDQQLKVGVGVLSSEIGYQQHLARYKTSIYAKAKSSYYQLLAKAYKQLHQDKGEETPLPDYAFADLNLQAYTSLPKGSLSVAVFRSQDRYDGTTDRLSLAATWGNQLVSARWKHRLGPAWLELVQGYSRYAFAMEHQRQETDVVDQATTGYFSNILFGLPLGSRGFFEAGAFLQHTQADMSTVQKDRQGRLLQKTGLTEKSTVSGAFSQAQLTFGKLTYVAGARLHTDLKKPYLAPRLKVELTNSGWASSLYYDRTYQFHHQVNVLGVNMPFDFLRLAPGKLPVQRSDQVGVAVNRLFNGAKVTAGAYHRWLDGQLYYANASTLLTDFEQDFESHTGRAYGIELEVQASWSKFSFAGGYTLAYSKLAQVNEFGERLWVYPVQDVRHQVNATWQYSFNKNWQLAGQWFLQTGSPYTFPVSIVPVQGMTPRATQRIVPGFERFNNIRTPVRHRLDVGVTYKKKHKKSLSEWNVGVYNLYNRANPYFLYFGVSRQEDGTGKIVAKQRSFLPLTPTLRYTCTFDL